MYFYWPRSLQCTKKFCALVILWLYFLEIIKLVGTKANTSSVGKGGKFMAKHNKTGQLGEQLALDFLIKNGFQILEINWRHGRSEVDIIAKEGDILVFIEVKTRSSDAFGQPEEFVSKSKEKQLTKAAAAYMDLTGHEWEIRFDVVSVLKNRAGVWEIGHLKDAFFPGL